MATRRSLLAVAVPLLVGGCVTETPATDQSSPSPRATDGSPSTTDRTATPDCMRGYTVSVSPFEPTEQLTTSLRPAQRRLFERIVAEDGVVLQTYGQRPIRTERYTRHDGTFYRIDYEQTATEDVPARRADLSWEKGQEAPEGEPVTAYSALPEVDQVALEFLIHGPTYSREGLPTQGLSATDVPVPYPAGTADSALVGAGTVWIEWEDRVYELAISTEEATITRRTFDYTATRVADSKERFRADVADRYLRALENLSTEERSVLDAAVEAGEDGTYEDCNEPSTGYETLKRRLADVPDLPAPHSDHWYISYEGERYLLEIGGWVV